MRSNTNRSTFLATLTFSLLNILCYASSLKEPSWERGGSLKSRHLPSCNICWHRLRKLDPWLPNMWKWNILHKVSELYPRLCSSPRPVELVIKWDVLIGKIQYVNHKIVPLSVTWRECTLLNHFRKKHSVHLVYNQKLS